MTLDDESSLLRRAHQFDPAALATIFDTFYGPLYRYAYHHVGHVETAEDLTAQVFQRFLTALKSGSAPTRYLKAWLFRVAYHLIVDDSRRFALRNHQPLDIQPLTDTALSLDETVQNALLIERARHLLHSLAPQQREVIILRFLSDMSLEETADVLQMTVGAVKAMQHRALTNLRRKLLPEFETTEDI